MDNNFNFLVYQTAEENVLVNALIKDETIWLTQKAMAELFDVNVPAISKHLQNIFDEGELQKDSTVSKMEIVQQEGTRDVKRMVEFYNLDAIISVGYRVNSHRATNFRIWATSVLKEYMIKGFATEGTKAYAISQMSSLIEKYDSRQMEAILSDTTGIQRIRGMAGSGKTIVLARKAVELHTAHPDWDIVVTYSTRTLKEQLISLISRFYAAKNEGAKYDESKLKVMQAWGSSSAKGVYYEICLRHGVEPKNVNEAKAEYGAQANLFSKVCGELLNEVKDFTKMYDCILIDEAQDFDKNYLKLCLEVLDSNKRLVYAYDELQKLNEEAMPDPVQIFGRTIDHDTPLTVCYRNQGRAIVTAHAIGMGLYRKDGLLQLPGSTSVWDAIGYVSDKPIEEGKTATLYRTKATSPELLKVDPDDIIQFLSYENANAMYESLLSYPEIIHIGEDKDFTPVIEKALALGGYPTDMHFTGINGGEKVMTGFSHNAVLSVADTVIDAVKSGTIKHFFLVGGCDGAKPGRNYYTEFVKQTPEDSIVLTLACGKYRFNDLDIGTIGGLPRIMDMGQCNDAYSAIKVAVALAEAFECNVNDLPLSMVLSWYEQKAVCILLTLLHLGIKNIILGPSLPAFVSPNVLSFLVDNYGISPITTPEQDLKMLLK